MHFCVVSHKGSSWQSYVQLMSICVYICSSHRAYMCICIYCHWSLLAFRGLLSIRHLMIPYQPHCPRHWWVKTIVAVRQFPSPKSKTIVAVRPSHSWHSTWCLSNGTHCLIQWKIDFEFHPRCVYCVSACVYCICECMCILYIYICECMCILYMYMWVINCETTKEALLFCGLFCGSLLVGQTAWVDFT